MSGTTEDVNSFLSSLTEMFYSGDPTVRKWALVESNYLPFVLSLVYVLFVNLLGPAFMNNRKPFNLRKLMIAYNFSIVLAYTSCLVLTFYIGISIGSYEILCSQTDVQLNNYTYWATYAGWIIYILKYVEYADTVFFVLRKKDHLITNLHVIHHATLPIMAWAFFRTERSGFQLVPGWINAFIHIIMYTYYGLAAMGPTVKKYLWWKQYLTMLQMLQFILIIAFALIIVPISGCHTSKHGLHMNICFSTLFLALFCNFYRKTYEKQSSQIGLKSERGPNSIPNVDGSLSKETPAQTRFNIDEFSVHSQIRQR